MTALMSAQPPSVKVASVNDDKSPVPGNCYSDSRRNEIREVASVKCNSNVLIKVISGLVSQFRLVYRYHSRPCTAEKCLVLEIAGLVIILDL